MYNNPFYMPGFAPTMMGPNLARGAATSGLLNGTRGMAASTLANTARGGTGLLSKLGTGLSGIRAINWGGLINNTSKTLGIINQTIPLVRQVGPMMNNMRSMLKIASIFKDETDTTPRTNYQQSTTTTNNLTPNNNNSNTKPITNPNTRTTNTTTQTSTNTNKEYNEAPTFFIAT